MAEREWTQPPASDSPQSLWFALHDGSIESVDSDRLAREVSLEIELGFPQPPEPCPERIVLRLSGVTHAFVFVSKEWPGSAPSVVTPITPETQAEVDEHRRKSRAETIGLDDFGRWTAREEPVEIMQAALERADGGLTLVLDGYASGEEDESWYGLRIGAESLDVILLDGSPFGLERLLRLGQSGWEDLDANRQDATVLPSPPAPSPPEGRGGS